MASFIIYLASNQLAKILLLPFACGKVDHHLALGLYRVFSSLLCKKLYSLPEVLRFNFFFDHLPVGSLTTTWHWGFSTVFYSLLCKKLYSLPEVLRFNFFFGGCAAISGVSFADFGRASFFRFSHASFDAADFSSRGCGRERSAVEACEACAMIFASSPFPFFLCLLHLGFFSSNFCYAHLSHVLRYGFVALPCFVRNAAI